jgi:hypothetical protein
MRDPMGRNELSRAAWKVMPGSVLDDSSNRGIDVLSSLHGGVEWGAFCRSHY